MKIFTQRSQTRVLTEIRIQRTVFRYLEVISGVLLHQVVSNCYSYGVSTIIPIKSTVDGIKVLPYFERLVLWMISIESSVGGQNEEEIAVVPGEVFVAQIISKIVSEVRPNSYIDLIFEANKQLGQKLILALSITHIQIAIFVVVGHRDAINGTVYCLYFRVVQMEYQAVQLENHEESLSLKGHRWYLISRNTI